MSNENFNTENFEYLKKQLEYLGLGHLAPKLEENIREEKAKFELVQTGQGESEESTVDYELQFNKHKEHPFYYFNRTVATLKENGEAIAVASFRASWKLTEEEMSRILAYGSKVAVYKEHIKNDAGESFNAWITVNVSQPLDEAGHLNVNTYHDKYYKKYPFDLDYSISRLPDQIKDQIKDKHEEVKSYMKLGIPYAVDVETKDGIVGGCLSVNAKVGRIDVLDENMELAKLAGRKEIQQAPAGKEQPQQTEQQKPEEKKKFHQQPMRNNQFRNNQGKGITR